MFLTEARRARRWWLECRGLSQGGFGDFGGGCFSRRHGGHGGGGLNVGGFLRGVLGILEGGVSHGGTEGTEVVARM